MLIVFQKGARIRLLRQVELKLTPAEARRLVNSIERALSDPNAGGEFDVWAKDLAFLVSGEIVSKGKLRSRHGWLRPVHRLMRYWRE